MLYDYTEEEALLVLEGCGGTCGKCSDFCGNDEAALDVSGLGCDEWEGYSCSAAVSELQYSVTDYADLLMGCPATCGSCEDGVAKVPVTSGCAEAEPSTCATWAGRCDWATAAEEGLGVSALLSLRLACPRTCGVCGAVVPLGACADVPDFRDEAGNSCADWADSNCQDARELLGMSQSGLDDLLLSCRLSCDVCTLMPHKTYFSSRAGDSGSGGSAISDATLYAVVGVAVALVVLAATIFAVDRRRRRTRGNSAEFWAATSTAESESIMNGAVPLDLYHRMVSAQQDGLAWDGHQGGLSDNGAHAQLDLL